MGCCTALRPIRQRAQHRDSRRRFPTRPFPHCRAAASGSVATRYLDLHGRMAARLERPDVHDHGLQAFRVQLADGAADRSGAAAPRLDTATGRLSGAGWFPRGAALAFQQRSEESSGGVSIASRLHEDVDHVAVLVHGGCLRHSLLIRQPICVRAATRTMTARLG